MSCGLRLPDLHRASIAAMLLICWCPLASSDGVQTYEEPSHPSASVRQPVDFDTQIIPLLTRFGCNGGACHGAAAGRGGLQLSLYGSRPKSDHEALALLWEGRRVNPVRPQQSLAFLKATGQIDHGGDLRFDEGSGAAELLLQWIREGARRQEDRRLVHFDVTASPAADTGDDGTEGTATRGFQIRAKAVFSIPAVSSVTAVSGNSAVPGNLSDNKAAEAAGLLIPQGHEESGLVCEDVTAWTVLTAQDPDSVQLSDSGRAVVRRQGRHIVMARFMDRVLPVELLVPFEHSSVVVQPSVPAASGTGQAIDRAIERKLLELKIPQSAAADDDMFLRRVSLQLTGRLPNPESMAAFRADSSPNKRRVRIDQMLQSEEFIDYWTYRLALLLRVGSTGNQASSERYHAWLREHVKRNTGLDQVFGQLVLAEGDPAGFGPAAFYLTGRDARSQAEFFTEALLGIRLRCANCHDHPLDQWTQDDYHGLAAIFAGVERQGTIRYTGRGTVIHPGTGLPAIPRIPGEAIAEATSSQQSPGQQSSGDGRLRDRRQDLLAWITADSTPLLARAIVNRVWKHLMGRGLVEPVDDLRVTNPATHPELLSSLTQEFVRSGYDLQQLIRSICSSTAYGRSSLVLEGNRTDQMFYSHALVQPLEPAVLLDAICDVTGVPETFAAAAAGSLSTGGRLTAERAVTLTNPLAKSASLDILGRCTDAAGCQGNSAAAAGLSVILHLINGKLLNEKLADPSGRVANLLAADLPDSELIQQFYRLTMSRDAVAEESEFWNAQLKTAKSRTERREVLEDFLWALLTSAEFREIR